ncbi:MAG: hypothetical protein K2X41_01280 [Hyphomicrobium sp.]|nr:hypothetical protein [Hyphomicrobium sp.]
MAADIVTRRMVEQRTRGFFGWIFLLLFWAFNILMVYGIFAGAGENAKQAAKLSDESMRDAYNAGTGLGIMVMLFVWAAGAVVFGLLAHFTRGKRELIEIETKIQSKK